MSHSNHSGRIARSMSDINPYMSGPVELMPEPKSRRLQDVVIYAISVAVVIGLAIAGQS